MHVLSPCKPTTWPSKHYWLLAINQHLNTYYIWFTSHPNTKTGKQNRSGDRKLRVWLIYITSLPKVLNHSEPPTTRRLQQPCCCASTAVRAADHVAQCNTIYRAQNKAELVKTDFKLDQNARPQLDHCMRHHALQHTMLHAWRPKSAVCLGINHVRRISTHKNKINS